MDLNISTSDSVPANTQGRPKEPNPFDGKFPTPVDAEGKPSGSLVVTLPSGTDAEKETVQKVARMAREAATAAGFTGRVRFTEAGTKAKPETTLTIWSTKKIKHKTAEEKAALAAETEANSDPAARAEASDAQTATPTA